MGATMSPQIEIGKTTTGESGPSSDPRVKSATHIRWLVLATALIVTAALLASGIWSRVKANRKLGAETSQVAVTAVSVVSPKQTAPAQEIILPGNVQPFISSPIYARTNGYLKSWNVDIGAQVKQGQLLAVIDAPEVDQQLAQSLSNLNTAKANLALAEITKNRYEGLIKTNAVAQQDVDNAVGSYKANQAIVEADEANVKQLQALQGFERVYAPFDGVVTARNTDIGDLIDSGSSGGVKTDLFHIAQPGVLRVNVTTRTLLIEVDVQNHTSILLTGSYAEVHLQVPTAASTFLIPVNTLLFRTEGLRVGVVRDGKVALATVTAGHDFGDQIEIVSGLKADDQVIVNPPDSIVAGQQVQIVQATLPGDT